MFECRFFTTLNCRPMGKYETDNQDEANEVFETNKEKYKWAYMVFIDENKNEKLLKDFQKIT